MMYSINPSMVQKCEIDYCYLHFGGREHSCIITLTDGRNKKVSLRDDDVSLLISSIAQDRILLPLKVNSSSFDRGSERRSVEELLTEIFKNTPIPQQPVDPNNQWRKDVLRVLEDQLRKDGFRSLEAYKDMNQKEKFDKCLDLIKCSASTTKKSCFIMYAKKDEYWSDRIFKDLNRVGIEAIYDKYGSLGKPVFRFNSEGIFKSDFVFVILTPNYFKESNQEFGELKFNENLLVNRLETTKVSGTVIPLLVKRDASPSLFVKVLEAHNCEIKDLCDENYYSNILKIFTQMTGTFQTFFPDPLKEKKLPEEKEKIDLSSLGSVLPEDKEKVNLEEAFLCPITHEIMENPVICEDGYTYEEEVIVAWFKKSDRSPMTNETLSSKNLIVNRALKDAIQQYKKTLKDK